MRSVLQRFQSSSLASWLVRDVAHASPLSTPQRLPLKDAVTLFFTSPVLVVLMERAVLPGDPPSPASIAGCAATVAGVWMVSQPESIQQSRWVHVCGCHRPSNSPFLHQGMPDDVLVKHHMFDVLHFYQGSLHEVFAAVIWLASDWPQRQRQPMQRPSSLSVSSCSSNHRVHRLLA